MDINMDMGMGMEMGIQIPPRVILPVNTKPALDCYTHYSNFLAIATNPIIRSGPDSRFGDMKWDFRKYYEQVPQEQGFAVNDYQCDTTLTFDENGVQATLKSRGGLVDTKTCSCVNFVEGDGSFTVRMDFLKKISPWVSAGITLFASGGSEPPTQATSDWNRVTDMRICVIGRGDIMTTVFHEGEDVVPWTFTPNPAQPDAPVWLRLTREGNQFTMLCSADGEYFQVHRTITLDNVPEKVAIGCITAMNDDGFYAWYYQNYIQLECAQKLDNFGGGVPLDFFGALRINEIYTLTNPWLHTDVVSYDTISIYRSYVDFCIGSVLNGYYVESTLNEFYMPFSSAFMRHDFPHRSMIYGFDLEEQFFYVLGYDKDKRYTASTVPFGYMEEAFRRLQREQDVSIAPTCLFKPDGPEVDIEVDTGIVKKMLTEYINSTDSGKRFDYMRKELPRIYGMAVYDEMIANVDAFLEDVRIAYLLHQHKTLMVERITFFTDLGKIEKSCGEKLLVQAKQVEKLSMMLQNLVLKYRITQSPDIKENIIGKLTEIKAMEQAFYPEIVAALSE